MNTLLVMLLATLLFFLVRQWPSPDPAATLVEAATGGARPNSQGWQVHRLDGWPRQALVLAASAAGAYVLTGEVLATWFDFAGKIGSAVGIGPGWLTIALLGGAAAIALALRRRPRPAEAVVAPAAFVPATPPVSPIPEAVAAPAEPIVIEPAISQPAEPARAEALSGTSPTKSSTPLIVGIGGAVLAGLALVALFFYPALSQKFSGPADEPSAAASVQADAPVAAAPTAQSSTSAPSQTAIEKALGDLAESARKAREARQEANGGLTESLAFAQANLPEIEIDRASFAIAEREEVVDQSREKARQALAQIERAMSADDGSAYRAFTAVQARPDVESDPDIAKLIVELYRIETPGRFTPDGLAAWDRVMPPRAKRPDVQPSAAPAAIPQRERPVATDRRAPFGERDRRETTPSQPYYADPRYSRQPGSARDRQERYERRQYERYPGVERLPSEEFQR